MAQPSDWERVPVMLDEFLRTSRKHAEDLVGTFRREIQRQADALGIATKDDVTRLERRVRQAEEADKPEASKKTVQKRPATRKAGAKKPSANS